MKRGSKVKVIELPLPQGYDKQVPEVKIGEIATVQYVDGCCLAVITGRGTEYTANATKFEPV